MTIVEALKDIVTTLGGSYSADDDTISELLDRINTAFENGGGGGGSSLPAVTTDDNGDVLTVVSGAWEKADAPTELPDVDAGDDGDFLGVEDGVWKCVDRPTDIVFVPFTVTISEQVATVTTTATFADVLSAVAAGKNVIAVVTVGSLKLVGGTTGVYPDTNPTALSFNATVDTGSPGGTSAPQILKITFSAESITASMVNLAVAT